MNKQKIIFACCMALLVLNLAACGAGRTGGKKRSATDKEMITSAANETESPVWEEDELYYQEGKPEIHREDNIEIDGRNYTYVKYAVYPNQTIRLISLKTNDEIVSIPSQIQGIPVERIGGGGLSGLGDEKTAWMDGKKQKVRKIVIQEGVKCILSGAFKEEISADEVVLPESIRKIGSGAFSDTKLKKVVLKSEDAKIEFSAFSGSTLKEIKFPDGYCGKIEENCFEGTDLERFDWPDYSGYNAKEMMGWGIFKGCDKLKEITFPEDQEHIYIPEDTFYGCWSLKRLEFPASARKVTYRQNYYADNYKCAPETLIFKGENTKLAGCSDKLRIVHENGKEENYNVITAGKIVAPKGSEAIRYAKKAKKVKAIEESLIYDLEHPYDELSELSIYMDDEWSEFAPMECEER